MDKNKLIAFWEGRLTPTEQETIAHKIKTDTKFAAKVNAFKADWEMQLLAGRSFLKEKMNQWETNEETSFFPSKEDWETAVHQEQDFINSLQKEQSITAKSVKVIPIWRKLAKPLSIAASLLFLLAVGTYQWSASNLSNQALLDEYYNADLSLARSKNSTVANNITNLETAMQEQKYDQVIRDGQQLLSEDLLAIDQVKVNYLLAQAYQKSGDYTNAIQYFEMVETTAIGSVKQTAQINSILLMVANGETGVALTKLQWVKELEGTNLGKDALIRLNELEKKLKHPLRILVQ